MTVWAHPSVMGAASVIQLEMMPKLPSKRTEQNPWPQWPRVLKTDYGQEEAIAVFGKDPRVYQTTVKEFVLDKGGNVTKAKLVKLEPKKDEKTGRTVMEEVPGSENIIDVDLVLIAAGFLGSQDYVTRAFGVKTDARTNVATEGDSYRTSQPAVFAAGDVEKRTVPGGVGHRRGQCSPGSRREPHGIHELVIPR